MEPGINLSRKTKREAAFRYAMDRQIGVIEKEQGVRTRALLILAMALVTMGTTFVSLLAIRKPLQNLVIQNLSSDLLHSLKTFEDMQAQRMDALDRADALLADLPSLKALMTTSDERTISDAGVEFWKVSGSDLFALADRDGVIKAAYTGAGSDANLRQELQKFLLARQARYFVSSKGLFGCSVQPIYFGSRTEGSLLGYVISGFAIDARAVQGLGAATNVQAAFVSGDRVLASSVVDSKLRWSDIAATATSIPLALNAGGEQFLASSHDLSEKATSPLTLVELKSLDQEERVIEQINRLILFAGVLALILGAGLMLALSRFVTLPLELLAEGVRAFGSGDSTHILPYRGTREVRELSEAFARMRREISSAHHALLESERLATIGRMASSVSHDLRHYLSAIYANSEFLASDKLPAADRNEILGEIRMAVNGTTEMLESLLVFSRTGKHLSRTQQPIAVLVERAISMVRAHPDAASVKFSFKSDETSTTEALVDAKQVERAIYNLLLNACQAPRSTGTAATVCVSVLARETEVVVEVSDNGDGVPLKIRSTLFDPFVSEGKHKGSGIGLTLTQTIAAEHDGNVSLVSSEPGKTVFRFTIARSHRNLNVGVVKRAEMG